MKGGRKPCTECGQTSEPFPQGRESAAGSCGACGAPLENGALSEFASRLARFGLGASRQPLLGRVPELPNGK